MTQKTQHWQVYPIGHTGWLGFLLWLCLFLFLAVWLGQYGLLWAALVGVGGSLLFLKLFFNGPPSRHTLSLCHGSDWLLSGYVGSVQPRRMWCSPYFCTVLLDTGADTDDIQRWVVCWRHHHTAEQWRTLVRLLRTGAWSPQVMRNH